MRPFVLAFLAAQLFAAAPTYHKDVLPILQKHCQGCHRPGEIGPMPLLTYSQVRPFSVAIRESVRLKKMPPWGADPAHGKFANDPTLTYAEIDVLSKWAAARAPEGNPKDAPRPLDFVEGWNIKPEQVFEMPAPFTIPAKGTVDYTYFVVPTNFEEDRWIQMGEVRPGNRSVVHHVIVYLREPGSTWLEDAVPGRPFVPSKGPRASDAGEYMVGYTPGKQAMQYPVGRAKLVKAGSDLIFQMHYTANGQETEDRTRVGLVFAKTPPTERVLTIGVRNFDFVIPPGAADYLVQSDLEFVGEARLMAMWPHMHLRGKSMRFEHTDAAGTRRTLLSVPRYDFNWQHRYVPAEPISFHSQSRVECIAIFDNSPNNRFNPDPKAEVRWGDQSWEEMMVGFIEIAFDAKKTPAEVIRRSKPLAVASN
jgi:hypothetical protein